MPESRDRLVRPVDIAAAFVPRRSGILDVLLDEGDTTQEGTPGAALGRGTGRGRGLGRAAFGTPRTAAARAPSLDGTPLTGRENTPMTGSVGRGRGRRRPTNSVLPSWYPRAPLGDITPVVRALERRRARLGETEGHETDSLLPLGPGPLDPSLQTPGGPLSLRHVASLLTPSPSVQKKKLGPPSVGKVPKILLNITNKPFPDNSSEFLTPQKKLLNQIDTVEKEVMEELRKFKRTPIAKKAEREKRVRTLMSMR